MEGPVGLGSRFAQIGGPLHVVDEAAQTVSMVDAAIDVAGVSVPTQVSQPVVDAMLAPVHVPLPYGLRLTGIAPHADAVTLQVGGEGVSVPLTR